MLTENLHSENLDGTAANVIEVVRKVLDGDVSVANEDLERAAEFLHLSDYQLSEDSKTELINKLADIRSSTEESVMVSILRVLGYLRIHPSHLLGTDISEFSIEIQKAYTQAALNASIVAYA